MLQSGVSSCRRDQAERFFGILVERDQADVRMRLQHDVGEELIARAFGLEPHEIKSQQHRLDCIARGVVGVDDR